ncbi:hypothetical protein CDAR_573071 [Caerostris darwini]|uniref:Uncharacterized protein n=1 Tax=Caerostris darwini TaxID=1538125 RepID=A0AAV4W5F9_9ARAC|nr:hypothetical protein CDAR_573071 [Caerostris darwini]
MDVPFCGKCRFIFYLHSQKGLKTNFWHPDCAISKRSGNSGIDFEFRRTKGPGWNSMGSSRIVGGWKGRAFPKADALRMGQSAKQTNGDL